MQLYIEKQVKNISWRDQMVNIFVHEDFKEDEMMMELYAVECFVKVEQEGPSDFFFEAVGVGDDANTMGDPTAQEILPDVVQENRNQLHPEVYRDEFRGAGVEVDDDNLPTPENIPIPNGEVQSATGDWGFNRQCYCRAAGQQGSRASKSHPPNWKIAMGGVHSHCYSFSNNFSPLHFLKMFLLQTSTKSLKGSGWNMGRCSASLDCGS